MKFKITSITNDGKSLIYIYNNITQDIFINNKNINLKEDPRLVNFTNHIIFSKKEFKVRTKEIKDLYIQLGFDCNYHCKYCSQANDRKYNKKIIPIKNNIDLDSFLNRLEKLYINPQRIIFWGGEPFVYIKQWKKIMPRIKEIFPNSIYYTVTNGSLLNKENIDFCINNNIQISMSHDGEGFNANRNDKNPLDNKDIINNINYYLDHCLINSKLKFEFRVVITPDNCNILNLENYFKEKVGRIIPFHFECIAKLDSYSTNIVRHFDKKTTNILLNQMYSVCTTEDNNHPYKSLRDLTSNVIDRLVNKLNLNDFRYYCRNVNSNHLAIDLQGNLLACHSMTASLGKYGTIEDAFSKIPSKELVKGWDQREQCKNCPVLVSCIGGCTIAKDNDHEIACENLKIYHLGLFISAWKLIFNNTIIKIEPYLE